MNETRDRRRRRRLVRLPTRMATDLAVIGAAGAVVVGLSRSQLVQAALPYPLTGQVGVVVAAVLATGTAVLGAMAARLAGDLRARWVAAALVLYAFVVLPLTVFDILPDERRTQSGALMFAYLVSAGLLAAAVRPPLRWGATATWSVAAVGAALTAVVLWMPVIAGVLVAGPAALVVVAATGVGAAAAILVDAYRRVRRPWWRIGLGLVVGVVAQLYSIGAASRGVNVALAVDGLRVVGLVAVVSGYGRLQALALSELRSEQSAQQEELSIAVVHMERASELAAERDHELRNGLAGLAGITHLLSLDPSGLEHERLRHAVLAELGRLSALLESGGISSSRSEDVEYGVEPVLMGLAILRRSAGLEVKADIDPDLRVDGDPAVLAQIVTNLLANCDRHARGADVVLRAYRAGENAVVEVQDNGPGLPPDVESHVLERGVQDGVAGGTGLGLYISRRLVEREGGSLHVSTTDNPGGCLAVVTVPRIRN